jgi:uncharacterized protein YlzI (FlbEa/FlbD family)
LGLAQELGTGQAYQGVTIGPEKAQRRGSVAVLLKLTRPDRGSTLVNPAKLEDIEENPEFRPFTKLTFDSGARIYVVESPSESAKLVENAGVKLIKLTRPDNKLRWINPNQVDNVRPSDVARIGFSTNIIFGSRTSVYVLEDPQTVAKLMAEADR